MCARGNVDKELFFDQLRTNSQFQKLRSAAMACHADFANDRDNRESKPAEITLEQVPLLWLRCRIRFTFSKRRIGMTLRPTFPRFWRFPLPK